MIPIMCYVALTYAFIRTEPKFIPHILHHKTTRGKPKRKIISTNNTNPLALRAPFRIWLSICLSIYCQVCCFSFHSLIVLRVATRTRVPPFCNIIIIVFIDFSERYQMDPAGRLDEPDHFRPKTPTLILVILTCIPSSPQEMLHNKTERKNETCAFGECEDYKLPVWGRARPLLLLLATHC